MRTRERPPTGVGTDASGIRSGGVEGTGGSVDVRPGAAVRLVRGGGIRALLAGGLLGRAAGGEGESGEGQHECAGTDTDHHRGFGVPALDELAQENHRDDGNDHPDELAFEILQGADLQPRRQLHGVVHEEFVEAIADLFQWYL